MPKVNDEHMHFCQKCRVYLNEKVCPRCGQSMVRAADRRVSERHHATAPDCGEEYHLSRDAVMLSRSLRQQRLGYEE